MNGGVALAVARLDLGARERHSVGHLADADAVEQHAGTDQKAGHRTIEHELIGLAPTETAGIVQPVHKTENGHDRRQDERANDDIGSPDFHDVLLSLGAKAERLRASAVEIGLHPGMIGFEHSRKRSQGGDSAVGQRGHTVTHCLQAVEIMGDHEHRKAQRPVQGPDQ